MKPKTKHLVVLTRLPQAGKTKTRLIPALGAQGAANLHDRLAKHALKNLAGYTAKHAESKLTFFITGGSLEEAKRWLGDIDLKDQVEGDLGTKISAAVSYAFEDGAEQVLVFGTDVPAIDEQVVASAFEALNHKDTVFGPAIDGGYYLMGLRRKNDLLFRDIHWGTEKVLQQSLANVKGENMTYSLLGELSDVDEPEDLAACYEALGAE